ncbi:TRAP transporter small permease [Alteromonas gilva]|uniref:TRAP transporter small permease protein n=1 Tax=Alteromonas gilva TaxID=2987522 RepID=A0ABT5L5I4_9ALTE|nr:TRAP transporter small permease [Alteromonas gilva]MDC8832310.1 TRAP transporter small permease [Alteromonas gilva]
MNCLDRVERTVCILLLALIVLLVFAAAVMRTMGMPIIWSVDVAQLLFTWLCMLGANQTLKHSHHASVDIITQYLPARWQQILHGFAVIIILAVLTTLVVYGLALFNLNPQRTLGSTDIPYRYVTLALPVGAVLVALTVLQQGWRSVKQSTEANTL